jgi:hypothetical protein
VAIAVASDADKLAVLRIGHVTSIRSVEGLSLREALARADYGRVRKDLNVQELKDVIARQPQLIDEWDLYSADKRTTGGWYLSAARLEIGQVELPDSVEQFNTPEEAVAAYVLRELEFWFNLGLPPNKSLERTREG